MNRTGKGGFTPGHTRSKGKGRPRKHEIIRQLEQLRDEVSQIPDQLLSAIANYEPVTLEQFKIPLSQINQQIQILASGFLYLRDKQNNDSE
ncbi:MULTISPECIES: hypothetical protein [unclassified Leclercia]|uniref:Phage protein n=1 Tax=Leclercia barmai TaxID=2785629 RepID=A0ABS7RT51_9ENTR|nr:MULTISPECIES: hypothetical protein [unclassified Leclercia]MBZ0057452.1 hypothetical protein [Leclercia sp. EMC7]MCM5695616.1 hypothetical protein [Leclercia sp. LTM01]MCM5700024.1 hypothetical protein [Leclercia sp. LTM14]